MAALSSIHELLNKELAKLIANDLQVKPFACMFELKQQSQSSFAKKNC